MADTTAKKPTIQVELSDKLIREEIEKPLNQVGRLTDLVNRVQLRKHAHKSGQLKTGAFYIRVYQNGKEKWHKIATWPHVPWTKLEPVLSDLRVKIALGEKPILNKWKTVGELLEWYKDRVKDDATLSQNRRDNIKSSITKHLVPCLGHELITEVVDVLDDEFYRPLLRSGYALGTINQHLATFKSAFSRAKALKFLETNPLADAEISLQTFTGAEIKPKPGRLKSQDLPRLLGQLNAALEPARLLCQLMLHHGTRKTETTLIRWDHIDGRNREIVLPGDITKTGDELAIPLTQPMGRLLKAYRAYQAAQGYTGVWLFPSPIKRGAAISETTADNWIRNVTQGESSAHDFRKWFRTELEKIGVDYWVAERLLNHKLAKLDDTYIKSGAESSKRRALEQLHDHITNTKPLDPAETGPRQDETFELGDALAWVA